MQAKDDAVELTRRQEIRKEFDDTFESVLDFSEWEWLPDDGEALVPFE